MAQPIHEGGDPPAPGVVGSGSSPGLHIRASRRSSYIKITRMNPHATDEAPWFYAQLIYPKNPKGTKTEASAGGPMAHILKFVQQCEATL